MLTGTTPLQELFPALPNIESFDVEPVTLENAEILQVQYEIRSAAIEKFLPPALHPTIPPLGIWTAWSATDSPWGAFNLVQLRLTCRSGARPRCFLISGAIDNPEAMRALSKNWGFCLQPAEIWFNRHYESGHFCVCFDDICVFQSDLKDPEILTAGDVQFFANMHGADTPRGPRLVQFDPLYEVHRAERYKPALQSFDGEAWGRDGIKPTYPVVAYGCNATIQLPKLRFLCKPEVSAFEGSESI